MGKFVLGDRCGFLEELQFHFELSNPLILLLHFCREICQELVILLNFLLECGMLSLQRSYVEILALQLRAELCYHYIFRIQLMFQICEFHCSPIRLVCIGQPHEILTHFRIQPTLLKLLLILV